MSTHRYVYILVYLFILQSLSLYSPVPPDKLARLIDEASENNLTIAILTQVRAEGQIHISTLYVLIPLTLVYAPGRR